jgi:MYXO-CTERM domain-containing protein
MLHELLSLGADVFERQLPEDEREPKPPELTKEEKDARKAELKELKPKERKEREKQLDEERKTIAVRKAMVERNKYILTRLHYRYDAASLPEDPKIGPAATGAEGGTALPEGPKMQISTEVKLSPPSRFQVRYNNFHPWVPVIHCQNPERGKWGKSPPDYRGLRKTWIAEDISRKSRTQIKPANVVITPIPALGLAGISVGAKPAGDAGVDGGAGKAAEGKCGCAVPGAKPRNVGALGALLGLALYALRRRSRLSAGS